MKFKETTDLTIHSAAPFDLQVITQHQQYIKKAAGFLAEKKLTYEDHTYQTYTHLRDDVKVKQTFAKALRHMIPRIIGQRPLCVMLMYNDYCN